MWDFILHTRKSYIWTVYSKKDETAFGVNWKHWKLWAITDGEAGWRNSNDWREDFSFNKKTGRLIYKNEEEKKSLLKARNKTKWFSQRQCLQCPGVPDQNQPAGLMFCRLWTKHTHLLLKEKRQTPSFIIIHITRPHKVWLPDEGECLLL